MHTDDMARERVRIEEPDPPVSRLRAVLRGAAPQGFRDWTRRVRRWAAYLRRFGAVEGQGLFRSLHASGPDVVEVAVPGTSVRLALRPGTSDIPSFEGVFVLREYEVELPFVPATIVDAGANVGAAAVYFATRYPDARVLAIEPNAENFALLQRNLAAYPQVLAVRAGVWGRHARLRIENPEAEPWAFRVVEAAPGEEGLDAITLDDAVGLLGAETLDLLKMDGEGAEREVFAAGGRWLEGVRGVLVELHERVVPGCEGAVREAVAGRGFAVTHIGENVVLIRGHVSRSAP